MLHLQHELGRCTAGIRRVNFGGRTGIVEPVSDPVWSTAGPGTGVVEVSEPEIRGQAQTVQGDPANDWLCAWCHLLVASEKDRFAYDGRSEFSFLNPDGIRFDILTFSRTIGCRTAGVPTLDHTWFPEHAWSYCLCDRCHRHLGWQYTGPHDFAGLIRERIVRKLLIMS
jgi:hypothetical protein